MRERLEAPDEVRAIPLIPEQDPALDPPHHDVVEGARCVEAGATRHGAILAAASAFPNGSNGTTSPSAPGVTPATKEPRSLGSGASGCSVRQDVR
jgi:hypothetical protein